MPTPAATTETRAPRRQLKIHLPPALADRFQDLCRQEYRSHGQQFEVIFREWLEIRARRKSAD